MEKTVQYKRTVKGSVGAGMGSLMGAKGRRYYILEYKDDSKYHKAGDSQKIIIDQVELGRASSCQVRFDETFSTVSRRHAAIVKEGDAWKLIQLSTTNSTLLNGNPVASEWYLQNGDEIQLSKGGPRLGFIVPEGRQSLVSSIKMTERLELFRKQALRPYKTALAVLGCLLLLLAAGGGYNCWQTLVNRGRIEENQRNITDVRGNVDSMQAVLDSTGIRLNDMATLIKNFRPTRQKRVAVPVVARGDDRSPKPVTGDDFNKYKKDVYVIVLTEIELIADDARQTIPGGSLGTGFLLSDGRFITARHVIEPWYYSFETEADMYISNYVAENGGSVVGHFVGVSPTGEKIQFTSSNFHCNHRHDKILQRVDSNGDTIKLREAPTAYDFAIAHSNKKGILVADNQLAQNLKAGDKLKCWGYALGMTAADYSPMYSEATVAHDGLSNGVILTTGTGFEHGNSGCPVFAQNSSGKWVVVGIVEGGGGRSTGIVVPISSVR